MNYGLNIAASGMLTNMARVDIYSNNLANVSTDGFKPHVIGVRQRDVARIEDGLFHLDSDQLLERLGGGVMPSETAINTKPAALRETGDPLHIGIDGPGFLMVESARGDAEPRLTRDGRLTINRSGELVTLAEGLRVLNTRGRPIRVNANAPLSIGGNGVITQAGQTPGRLALVEEPGGLTKEGESLFKMAAGTRTRPSSGRIVQGHLEQSGVNAIDAMMEVMGANKAVQSNARLISYFDETMDRAINTLGRVG